ncbi:MAG: SGNH/GDSL hydrolase family protein [Actinomycetota bacterium]
MGASDALGIGADDPETEGWVKVFHERMPKGTILHRLGASGATAAEARAELLPHLERAGPPDIVTIWLAVNDFRKQVPLNEYLEHLGEILGRAAATGADVFVGNLPELVGIPDFDEFHPDELREVARQWNEGIANLAETHGAVVVDIMEASDGLGEERSYLLAEDRFHPSSLGHLALAEIFFHYFEMNR